MGLGDLKIRRAQPSRRLPIQSTKSTSEQEQAVSAYASVASSKSFTIDSASGIAVEGSNNESLASLNRGGSSVRISDVEIFSRKINKNESDLKSQTKNSGDPISVTFDTNNNSATRCNVATKRSGTQHGSDGSNSNDQSGLNHLQNNNIHSSASEDQQELSSKMSKRDDDTHSESSSAKRFEIGKSIRINALRNHNRNRRGCSCDNCLREDCGVCNNCLGKVKFGGDGKNHQRCCERFCLIAQHSDKSMVKRISKHTGAEYFTTYLGPEAKQSPRSSTTTIADIMTESQGNSLKTSVYYKQNESISKRNRHTKNDDSVDNNQHKGFDRHRQALNSGSSTSSDLSMDSDDMIIAHLKRMAAGKVSIQNDADISITSSRSSQKYRNQIPNKASKKRKRNELTDTAPEIQVNTVLSDEAIPRSNAISESGRCRTTSLSKEGIDPSNTSSTSQVFFIRKRLRERVQDAGGINASTSTANMSSSYYSENHHAQRAHRVRCKKCIACKRPVCGLCYSCLSRKMFGGDGKSRQSRDPCIFRRCHIIYPPMTTLTDSFCDSHVVRNTTFFLDNFYTMFCHKARPDVEEIFTFNRYILKRVANPKSAPQSIDDVLRMLHQLKQQGQKPLKRNSNELLSSKSSSHITVLSSTATSKQVQHQQSKKQKKRPANYDTKKQQSHLRQTQQKKIGQIAEPEDDSDSLFLTAVMNAMPKDFRKPASSVTRRNETSIDADESSSSSTSVVTATSVESKSISFYGSIIKDILTGRELNACNKDITIPTKVNYDSAYVRLSQKRSKTEADGCIDNKNDDEECFYGIPIDSDPAAKNFCAGCRGAKDPDDGDDEVKSVWKNRKSIKRESGDDGSECSSRTHDSISSHATIDSNNKMIHSSSQQATETNTVLLCDGYKCRREYHLGCCVPSLRDVPDVDRWLCVDCCRDNMTSSLVKYLEEFDEARASFFFDMLQQRRGGGIAGADKRKKLMLKKGISSAIPAVASSYVFHLVQNDISESDLPTNCDVPTSELERFARTTHLATLDMSDAARQQRAASQQSKSEKAIPSFYEPAIADLFLGKPIRMYDAISNRYHTGRIVDYREATTSEAVSRKRRLAKSEIIPTEVKELTYQDVEFLIRFPAGIDDRKSCHYHWIVLEEHALAVGMTIVWAKLQARAKTWKPSIVWYRTARELIPIQHLLDGDKGEIYFQLRTSLNLPYSQKELIRRSRGRHFTNKPNKKIKRKAMALMRTFCSPQEYAIVDARQNAVDLMNEDATAIHKTSETMLSYEIALAEVREQIRVQEWWSSIRGNQSPAGAGSMAFATISSQDYYRMPSLIPRTNFIPNLKYNHRFGELQGRIRHGASTLCPNVQLGLDRKLVLQLLGSDDEAKSETNNGGLTVNESSNIVCDIVSLRNDGQLSNQELFVSKEMHDY